MLLLAVTPAALLPAPRAPPPRLLCGAESDLLGDIRSSLRSALSVSEIDESSAPLMDLHSAAIKPLLPKIFTPSLPDDERRTCIEGLSRALDVVEEATCGPLLVSSKPAAADAVLFPSILLVELTLPEHFGWTEWTDEALFYRRPRLHAWRELLAYERAARAAEEQVAELVAKLDLSAVAMDVPTSRIRSFPKHA